MVVVPVKAWADHRGGGTTYYIDGKKIAGVGGTVPLPYLEDWSRGALIIGGTTEWEDMVLGGIAGSIVTRNATDVLWSTFALAGTAGQTYTFPTASGSVPTGSGTAGRVVQWAAGGATLEDSTLIKSGAGVLTLSAAGAYTATVPASGTVALGAGTLTVATTNDVTGATHTHAITSSSNPGAAARLLATDASGYLQLAGLGVGIATTSQYTVRFYRSQTDPAAATYVLSNIVTSTYTADNANQVASFTAYTQPSVATTKTCSGAHFGVIGGVNVLATHAGALGALHGLYALVQSADGAGGTISELNAITAAHGLSGGTRSTAITTLRFLNVAALSTLTGTTVGTAYGIQIGAITGATANYSIYGSAGLYRFGDQLSIVGSADRQQLIVTGYSTQAIATSLVAFTRNDAAAGVSKMLALTGLGSGADGDGVSLDFYGKSSTTAAQQQARIYSAWAAGGGATHASRKAKLVGACWDTAEREGWQVSTNGSAPMFSVLGATPVVQQAHIADAAGGATVDAEARAAVNAALAVLEAFGFVATA